MGTKLGQNFLVNPSVIDFIIQDVKKYADLTLPTFEIGPGKCALTKELVKIKPDLVVFEKDENLKPYLEKCVKKENIILGDFLQVDLDKIFPNAQKFNAIGNLPYYITSPIFRKLVLSSKPYMEYGIFMIQKEVGEKIKTDTKNKSMLWYLVNLNHKITYLKTIPPEDFSPPPKVESCLVRFEYTGENVNINPDDLFNLLSVITPIRKKTLGKIQKILEKQGKKLIVPESLLSKRIHELDYQELASLKLIS